MRIGFLITYFFPQIGGAENNCYYLARELAKKHEVHVFCSGQEDSEEVIDNIKVHRAKERFRVRYYLASYPSLTEKMLANPVDLLHIHGLGFSQHDSSIALVKQKFPNMKLICTPHGPFMALKDYGFLATLFKTYYTSKIKKAVKSYDAVIEVNPYQKEWMTNLYDIDSNKVHLIPNGVPKATFVKISSEGKKTILSKYGLQDKIIITYVGRIQRYKGLDQIINVLPYQPSNTVVVLVGDDSGDKKRLEELAIDKNVISQVIFTGRVSEQEKLSLLETSDIFIFPSEWEAFGIATLEAMARGNAIISTRTEGGRYLIEDGKNGFLFDFGDLESLKQKLSSLIANPLLLKKMQATNRQKSKSFLWEDIANSLEELYKKL
jgi:glycosyltransferase involved in cell wall biosynthesis